VIPISSPLTTRAGELHVELREELKVKNFDSPEVQVPLLPALYDATIELSSNGKKWLVLMHNERRYGWSFEALERVYIEDFVRIYKNDIEVTDLDLL
jgi:hypothetical protein